MKDTEFTNRLQIATPCTRTWESLQGDGAKRWCGDCRLHVYDFSQMRSREVRALMASTEERVCGRLMRRADGTVITADCGPIRERLRRRAQRIRAAAAALLGLAGTFTLSACSAGGGATSNPPDPMGAVAAPPEDEPPLLGEVCPAEELMGKPAPPPDTAPPAPTPPDTGATEELGDVVGPRESVGRIKAPEPGEE